MSVASYVILENIGITTWLDGIASINADTLGGAIDFHEHIAAIMRTNFHHVDSLDREMLYVQLLMKSSQFNEKFGRGTINLSFAEELEMHLELESSRCREVEPDADGVRRPMGVRGHPGNSQE